MLFHRVLPRNDIRWPQSDKCWSVSDDFFDACLAFFNKHYNVISLDDISAFLEDGKPLPHNALLITFDDGWADNLQYAVDISNQHSIKPLLFVTTSAIGTRILSWQETLVSAWQMGQLPEAVVYQISRLINSPPPALANADDVSHFIAKIQQSSGEIKTQVLDLLTDVVNDLPGPDQMLTADELKQLSEKGFSTGTHGVRHEPFTQVENPEKDLYESRLQLAELIQSDLPTSMSFPHGKDTSELITKAREAGYKEIFTGKNCLNRINETHSGIFGRYNIEQGLSCDNNGKFMPQELAMQLFFLPVD